MPTGITVRKQIDAPPERVFAAATDLANAPKRIEGITRMELLTPGPVATGTRFRETRVLFGREATEELEVQGFEPPRRFSIGCDNHGCRYRTEFRFEPSGEGTEVELRFEATPLTLVARVMSVLTRPLMGRLASLCEKDLEDIKRSIESGSERESIAGSGDL